MTAAAQETTATVTGTVTDQSGGVLPGVTVSLKHVATGRVSEGVTGAEGGYLMSALPIGAYEVTFTLSGFQTRTVRGVALNVNDRVQVDAALTTGGVSEVVEVTGRTLVQTTTAVQNLIDSRQVQELPINNRNFAKLVELAPGVSSDFADEVSLGLTSNMSISVNGARRNAVNWLVDGVMNVDVGSNITLLSTPTLESIEQFKIITSSYAAEWPRSGGGIINVVTKSGTSKFCGSGYEFFRNDKLNSNSYFRKQATDPLIRDQRAGPRIQQLRIHGRRSAAEIEGEIVLFLLRRAAPHHARARLVDGAGSEPGLADRSDQRQLRAGCGARPDRGAVAGRVSRAEYAAAGGRRRRPVPGDVAEHQQHAAGSDPHGLRPQQHAAAVGTLHARSQRDAGAGRPVLRHRRFRASPAPRPRVPGQVGAFGLRSIIGSNKLNELNYHFSANNISTQPAEGVRNTRADFGVTIPEVFPENVDGLIPVIDVTGLSTAWRQPVDPHPVPQSLDQRQLLVAARQPLVQDGRPRHLRAEERERGQPQPGRIRVRRHHRRRHGVSEFPARQPRRLAARPAATPRPSATSTCSCASTASSSTRRTRGGRPRG